MGQFAWQEQVAALSAMVGSMEANAAQVGTAGLEELKSSLDELRLRAWGLLTAASSDDPHGFQERFRTRRGTEMCRTLVTDLGTGKLSSRASGLSGLGTAAEDLAAAVKNVTQKPAKKSGKKSGKKAR